MNAHAGRIESGEKVLRLGGHAFVADHSGALFCPENRLLLVADLHLEKGSSFAQRRVFLPPYDTSATLARLAAVIARLDPKRVIALGDSFHDGAASGRLMAHDVQALRAMQVGRDWLWIAGNHDPAPPAALDGDHATELAFGAIRLCHEPSATTDVSEIAGHLHPVAVVGGTAGAVRRRCFVANATRCVMPAFGAYAGGLNLLDRAVMSLFGATEPYAHVLGRAAVFSVGRRQCLAERNTYESWR